MKTVSVREFRNSLARMISGSEPLIITRHGKSIGVFYPLENTDDVPLEVRRSVVDSVGRAVGARPAWPVGSSVIARYKRGVDRTLIRENLRRTHEERLIALQKLQQFAAELRRAR